MRSTFLAMLTVAAFAIAPGARAQPPRPLVGSAPQILGPLARAWRGGVGARRITLRQPFGPPQGRLDPALEAFLEGRGDFAFLTRELATADRVTYRRAHDGRDPLVVPVAGGAWNGFGYVDPVVFIVNAANPITTLDFGRIDAIFSSSRLRSGAAIDDWGAAGVAAWTGHAVHRVGGGAWEGEESARALTVRRHILDVGARAGTWRCAPGSGAEADVVARVAADPFAIGFTGLGHLGAGVHVVAIDRGTGRAVPPTRDAIAAARYPLVRTVDLLLATGPSGRPSRAAARLAGYLIGGRGQHAIDAHPPFQRLAPVQRRQARHILASGAPRGTVE